MLSCPEFYSEEGVGERNFYVVLALFCFTNMSPHSNIDKENFFNYNSAFLATGFDS